MRSYYHPPAVQRRRPVGQVAEMGVQMAREICESNPGWTFTPDGQCLAPAGPAPGTGPPPPPPTSAPILRPSGPAPSMPPPPGPGLPPETVAPVKASLFGLPPVAVYIGLGALGLLVVARVAKKRKRRRA